jgi:hypothetical protein
MIKNETPEKKKARLRYDNVFKTAWTDEVHFIKHSRKGINLHFVNSAGLIYILCENFDVGVI